MHAALIAAYRVGNCETYVTVFLDPSMALLRNRYIKKETLTEIFFHQFVFGIEFKFPTLRADH